MTDSFGGAIWRSRRGEPFSLWVADPLLEPLVDDPFGFPLPGANGIAFYPPDNLYVANTERGLIARVRIERNGSAGPVEAATAPFAVPTVDGIAMDVHGQIHAALPGFSLFGASPLVSIDPATGAVTPTVVNPVDITRFDTPFEPRVRRRPMGRPDGVGHEWRSAGRSGGTRAGSRSGGRGSARFPDPLSVCRLVRDVTVLPGVRSGSDPRLDPVTCSTSPSCVSTPSNSGPCLRISAPLQQ